ncbi:MAG: MATE family efflux transporter [Planctomycetota bacterium]
MSPWRREIRDQLRLALPVITIQVGLMLMGVVDTLMMGRVSDVEMAAVAIGNTWHFGMLCFGLGCLQALDPIVSQAFGAGDEPAISRAMQRGLLLALLLSAPVVGLILLARPALELFDQPAEVIPIAADYCRVSVFGVPAFLLFVALRQSLQAQHKMRPLVLTIVCANVLNAALDWMLIHGNFGLPKMGAVGCSWATVVARATQVGALFVFAGPLLWPHLRPLRRGALTLRPLLRMLGLGAPIGVQFMLEIGAFSIVALLMGKVGAELGLESDIASLTDHPGSAMIGGHMVSLNLAALAFMVPLGMSMAASVRVGNEIGRGNSPGARRAAAVALLGGLLFMSLTSALFLLLPGTLARAYTDEAGVLAVAVTLLPVAGIFQVFDGAQVVSGGVLRGAGDTRIPMLVHLFGFWAVGIPFGWYMAFERRLGPAGLWWGLVAGLAAVAVVLLFRVRSRLSGVVARVRIEDEESAVPADRVGEA